MFRRCVSRGEEKGESCAKDNFTDVPSTPFGLCTGGILYDRTTPIKCYEVVSLRGLPAGGCQEGVRMAFCAIATWENSINVAKLDSVIYIIICSLA